MKGLCLWPFAEGPPSRHQQQLFPSLAGDGA